METPETHEQTVEDIQGATAAVAERPEGKAETSPAERQAHDRLYEHTRFVHVGPEADKCPDVDEEKFVANCGNPLHFHGWIKTPNQFEHNSIRTKALAAKARKLRALRDEESDIRVVLDGELEELLHVGDRDSLVRELLNKDRVKNYWNASRGLQETEEFEHHEDDRERFRALSALDPEKRDEEEYERLGDHLTKYAEKLQEEIINLEKPVREALEAKPTEELIDLIKEERIQAEAQQEFEDVYSLWEWYIGTMQLKSKESSGHPKERYFGDVEALKAAPAEIISALSEAFTELDAEAGRALGN